MPQAPTAVPAEGNDQLAGPTTAGTTLVTIRDSRTNALIKNVRESLRKMTCGVHPYFDVKIVIPPDQYVISWNDRHFRIAEKKMEVNEKISYRFSNFPWSSSADYLALFKPQTVHLNRFFDAQNAHLPLEF